MNELKSGAALNYAVILLNIIVGLLYTPYMLRALGQSEYGMYSLVASVISCLTVLDLGLGNAVVRYTAHFRADGRAAEIPRLLGMFLAMYIGVGVLSMVCGGVLYVNFDGWFAASMTPSELHDARLMLLLLVANVAFTFPMSVFGSVLTAYERFVFPRVLQIARIVLSTVLMVVLLSLGFKALALVVVQTLFNVAVLCAQMVYARSHLGVRIRFRGFDKELLRQVAVYSFWVFLSVVMDRIYWSTGQMVLAFYDGTAQVAVFAVAIQLSLLYM
ncbi:MAG: oligosaccharide flippase family protein, partial [Bacteroidaceae bacterium]|nr:oligosaccharide flippase family protein [Bacteroidaceae bacterium]